MTIKIAIKYFKTITIGTAISTLLLGCIDQIDFESKSATMLLVVDGRITNSDGPHSLELGITTGINTTPDKITTPVEAAQITIFDNLGNQEDYFEIEPGIYLLPGNIVKGIPGVEYFIEITIFNGSKFRSVPETMPQKIENNDSIIFEFGKKDVLSDDGNLVSINVLNVSINSQIPETANPVFVRWHVEENYQLLPTDFPDPFGNVPPPCYITEFPGLGSIPLYNGSKLTTGVLNDLHLYSRELDFSFQNRHYFNVIRSTISSNAMEYWEKLDKIASRTGSIFDSPPSPVQGNILNIDDPGVTILGFFEAITTDTTRRFTLPNDLPESITSCKYNGSSTGYLDQCLNCLIIPNSSLSRPSYWP